MSPPTAASVPLPAARLAAAAPRSAAQLGICPEPAAGQIYLVELPTHCRAGSLQSLRLADLEHHGHSERLPRGTDCTGHLKMVRRRLVLAVRIRPHVPLRPAFPIRP